MCDEQGRAGQGQVQGQGQHRGRCRGRADLEEVIHHLGTEASSDRGAVLQAGAAVHLNQPHIQRLIHHKVIPKQLMAVGPGLQALLYQSTIHTQHAALSHSNISMVSQMVLLACHEVDHALTDRP